MMRLLAQAYRWGRAASFGLLGVAWLIALQLCLAASDFERLQAAALQRWGGGIMPRFNAWRNLVVSGRASTDADRIRQVNFFFNRQTRFGEDEVIWQQTDYWATPLETLGRGAGDCEDFAIAKYFTLLEAGVAPEKLRLIYVRAKVGISDSTPTQAHMVLAYYAQPEAEPLVLDNLVDDIRPASRRPDLVPVFSFSRAGVFTGVSAREATPAASTGRLSRWEDLLRRAKVEGFD